MIEITDVTKRYGRRVALSSVSLTLHPGEVTLLLGANGAGKSTLLRCLLGITDFDGEIRVAGRDPRTEGRAVRSLIGYMPQSGGLHLDLTVDETMRLYADIRRAPRERCAVLLEEAGLTSHATTRVGELSGGMRQRLGFALALLTDPHILVLDEPSSSLDAASMTWLAGRLRGVAAEGRIVLVSTHAGQELMDAGHRRVVLEDGRVVSCEPGPAAPNAASRGIAAARTGSIVPVIKKELRDAVGNRWLIGYAALLGTLGLAATAMGLQSTYGLALQAFGRTTATLMNLCLLLAPLVAVLMGAGSIAGERERGTLDHLLAQPLTRTGLLLGKHAGLLAALVIATLAGFLPAGVLIAYAAGPGMIGHYLLFPAIATLAGVAMAGVGLLISVSSRSAVQAQGTGVFAWFAFVLLYDLVLMGLLAASGMPPEWLAAALVANPVDAARVLGVLALEPDLYLLGPAGAYIAARFSSGGAAALLLGALAFWATAPVAAAVIRFALPRRRRARVVHLVAPQTLSSSSAEEVRALMINRTLLCLVALTSLGIAIGCSSEEDSPAAAAGVAKPAASASANTVTPAMIDRGRAIYKGNCVACHGDTGKGDGPASSAMKPPPRDHTEYAYMSTLTDKQVADVIKMGGAIKGRPLMPSHPAIGGADMDALVVYIRTLSAPK